VRVLAIGHIARDEPPDGAWRPGGSALYAAATAARLGAAVTLVTRLGRGAEPACAALCAGLGITLAARLGETTTTFAFGREATGRRSLRLLARADALTPDDIPPLRKPADAVIFGPIANEVGPAVIAAAAGRVRVLGAQGYLRRFDPDGTVRPARWRDRAAILAAVDAVVVSEEDVGGDHSGPREWSATVPVVLTLGARGALLYNGGGIVSTVPAYPAGALVEETGAGDAFAAGLAIGLAEGRPLAAALRFASAAASFAVEGPGTTALGDRAMVEARLARSET